MEKIGIDVHKVASQVCILTEDGEFKEFRIRTERDSLTETFGRRARARILLEAATESEWVARHLEALGHEVIVADPNFAPMYASRSRKVKTDKRDARALCEACHLGAYQSYLRGHPIVMDCDHTRMSDLRERQILALERDRQIATLRRFTVGNPRELERKLARLDLVVDAVHGRRSASTDYGLDPIAVSDAGSAHDLVAQIRCAPFSSVGRHRLRLNRGRAEAKWLDIGLNRHGLLG